MSLLFSFSGEVKLKVYIKGISKHDNNETDVSRDDLKVTKDDYKPTCHAFVKLVMGNQRRHLRELKTLMGFTGISIQRLSKLGFNMNVFILCHSLGALELLFQSYTSGRLLRLVHSALVTKENLDKLKVKDLDLCVDLEEGLINQFREILLLREAPDLSDEHPVDELSYFRCTDDTESEGSDVVGKLDQGRVFTC